MKESELLQTISWFPSERALRVIVQAYDGSSTESWLYDMQQVEGYCLIAEQSCKSASDVVRKMTAAVRSSASRYFVVKSVCFYDKNKRSQR